MVGGVRELGGERVGESYYGGLRNRFGVTIFGVNEINVYYYTMDVQCKECGELLTQTPGKRLREYCNSTCRSNYWQKLKRKNNTKAAPMPVDYVEVKEIKAISIDGTVNPIIPKNLAELKAMCPPELTGLDRSEWISDNRLKYGI
jgi:hypothetical protein